MSHMAMTSACRSRGCIFSVRMWVIFFSVPPTGIKAPLCIQKFRAQGYRCAAAAVIGGAAARPGRSVWRRAPERAISCPTPWVVAAAHPAVTSRPRGSPAAAAISTTAVCPSGSRP